MKYLIIISLATVCLAELPIGGLFELIPPSTGPANSYGPPSYPSVNGPYPASKGYYPPPVTKITKDIYVHVPPPDNEEYDTPHHPPTNHKNYKIIFIKAPSFKPKLPPPNQDEEKTIVYVLYKKPELEKQVEIPKKPSKPEVYFIKYKTQKEQPVYGPPPVYGAPSNDGPYHK